MKRTTRIATITAAATAVAIAGATYAVAQDGGTSLDGDSLDRATQAALAETGGGSVTGVEADDGGYDVEIRLDDGTEVDVDLDADFAVVRTSTEAPDQDDDDADDRALSDTERQQAIDAALAEAEGGEVIDVEADDGGYDVEIRLADGRQLDVELDAGFKVVSSEQDD